MWKGKTHPIPYLKMEGKIINGIKFNFPTDKRHGGGRHVVWNVTCKCGNVFEYSASLIKLGRKKTCGCNYNWEPRSEKGYATTRILGNYKSRCARKKISFELTRKQFESLIYGDKCFYDTGDPNIKHEPILFIEKQAKRNIKVLHFGIDRVDNMKGYIIGNCVTCCKECNYLKRDYSIETMKRLNQILYTVGMNRARW